MSELLGLPFSCEALANNLINVRVQAHPLLRQYFHAIDHCLARPGLIIKIVTMSASAKSDVDRSIVRLVGDNVGLATKVLVRLHGDLHV
nr:putative integron gene cassette protein [uncultured bacterium]